MKKIINKFLWVLFTIVFPFITLSAQPPDPLGGSGTPGSTSCGSSTPISVGTYIFLVLAISYGLLKYYQYKKQKKIILIKTNNLK